MKPSIFKLSIVFIISCFTLPGTVFAQLLPPRPTPKTAEKFDVDGVEGLSQEEYNQALQARIDFLKAANKRTLDRAINTVSGAKDEFQEPSFSTKEFDQLYWAQELGLNRTFFERLKEDTFLNCLLYTSPSPRDS